MNEIVVPATDNVLKMELKLDQGYSPEVKNSMVQVLQEILPSLLSGALQEQLEGMQANQILRDEKVMNGIKEVEGKVIQVEQFVKAKYISPQDLGALESLVSEKAKIYVDKKGGVQMNIDMVLNSDPESLRDLQKLIKREHGRIKQRIWVELNKDCLERKGTDPKNRIKDTQVESAFDFVRRWGGFSI